MPIDSSLIEQLVEQWPTDRFAHSAFILPDGRLIGRSTADRPPTHITVVQSVGFSGNHDGVQALMEQTHAVRIRSLPNAQIPPPTMNYFDCVAPPTLAQMKIMIQNFTPQAGITGELQLKEGRFFRHIFDEPLSLRALRRFHVIQRGYQKGYQDGYQKRVAEDGD